MIEFRKEVLDEQFAPESTERFIKLTSPSVYLLLLTMILLGGALVLWGVMGSVTDKAKLGGMIYPLEGIESVTLPNSGVVRQLLVHTGDRVEKGQTLAMVEIGQQYSVLSSTCSGEVLSMKEEQMPFQVFEPIVTIQTHKAMGMVKTLTAFADFKTQRELTLDQEVQVNPSYLTREANGYIPGKILSISTTPISQEEALRKMKVNHFAENVFPQSGVAFEVQIELETNPNDPNRFAWTFQQERPVDMRVGTYCNIQVITRRRSIIRYMFENIRERYRKVHEVVLE